MAKEIYLVRDLTDTYHKWPCVAACTDYGRAVEILIKLQEELPTHLQSHKDALIVLDVKADGYYLGVKNIE